MPVSKAVSAGSLAGKTVAGSVFRPTFGLVKNECFSIRCEDKCHAYWLKSSDKDRSMLSLSGLLNKLVDADRITQMAERVAGRSRLTADPMDGKSCGLAGGSIPRTSFRGCE